MLITAFRTQIDTELYVKSGTTDWGSEGKKYDISYAANKDA